MLESYVTRTHDKAAALAFMKEALTRHSSPDVITTDGLRSDRAAMDDLGNAEKQEMGRWANNRVENSHLPFRRRERAMQRFRQMKTPQKFASVHANVRNHLGLERHLSIDRRTGNDAGGVAGACQLNVAGKGRTASWEERFALDQQHPAARSCGAT